MRMIVLLLSLTVMAGAAWAEERTWRLCVLTPFDWPADTTMHTVMLPELARRGFVEGRNLVVLPRWGSNEDLDQLARLAQELAAARPDVILAVGPNAIKAAAKQADFAACGIALEGVPASALPKYNRCLRTHGWAFDHIVKDPADGFSGDRPGEGIYTYTDISRSRGHARSDDEEQAATPACDGGDTRNIGTSEHRDLTRVCAPTAGASLTSRRRLTMTIRTSETRTRRTMPSASATIRCATTILSGT
jgi:hypothetical protein